MTDQEIIGNNIDQAITIEMRSRKWPRGIIQLLGDAAREEAGTSMVLKAARDLIHHVKPGDNVLITCVAAQTPWVPFSETDGPPGAAALARVISKGLGAIPCFVLNNQHLLPTKHSSMALGIPVFEDPGMRRPGCGIAVDFPLDIGKAESASQDILNTYSPSAVVAIETMAPNPAGIVHSASGKAVPDSNIEGAYYKVLTAAVERGIYSVGIGDAGNECGMGRILPAIHDIHQYGAHCLCPCDQGIASVVSTDSLIVSSCSNWGAYGLAAMLAYLLNDQSLFHNAIDEERMLRACVSAGGIDAFTGEASPSVDGISLSAHVGLNNFLNEIVRNGLI
jgi:hypothetical protein